MTSCRSPEWPDTLEFLSVFARSFQKRFYFALFAVGYDTCGAAQRFDRASLVDIEVSRGRKFSRFKPIELGLDPLGLLVAE